MAVRNIDHVKNSITTCIAEFGLEEIISYFSKRGNADTCRCTLQAMTDSGVKIVSKKKQAMLERAARKVTKLSSYKGKLLPKIEEISRGKAHVNTRKLNRNIFMVTDVFSIRRK